MREECIRLFQKFADPPRGFQDLGSRDIWRTLVHTLDLAVLSYAGANTQPLGQRTFEDSNDFASSQIVPAYYSGSLHPLDRFIRPPVYTMKIWSYDLTCLRSFLGESPIWAFQWSSSWQGHWPNQALWLATEPQTFANTWGPMWKSCVANHPEMIHHFNVGGGRIIPTIQEPDQHLLPLGTNEVMSHWVSAIECSEHGERTEGNPVFTEHSVLLIGGGTPRLRTNRNCEVDNLSAKKAFED